LHATISLLNTLLPMLYAIAALAYLVDFFRDDPLAEKAAWPLLVLVVALHATYLALRTSLYEHIPLASMFEVMTVVAFAVAVVYLYVEYRTKTHKTGMFLITFSFVFQTISSAFIKTTGDFPVILRSPLFGIHTGSAVIGYTAFAVSAIYGVLYLLLYHDLKASRFGVFYQRLPSLDILAKMSLRAAVFGVVFLTSTILFGAIWASQKFPNFYEDPKFIMTLVVWSIYVLGILLHYGRGWAGKRTVYFSLFGFALIVFSMIAARYWLPSFHGFA
jgi:ABC-type uncharacterized transport system permease subunit